MSEAQRTIGFSMKLSYDAKLNIAYIRLRPESAGVETIRVSDELNIDMSPDGSIFGIELLNANEQLNAAESGRLVVELAGEQAGTLDLTAA